MAKKGVTPVTDGIGDGWKASCRGDVFVPDELVPFDLQQLPLTLHMKGLEGSGISGDKKACIAASYSVNDRCSRQQWCVC